MTEQDMDEFLKGFQTLFDEINRNNEWLRASSLNIQITKKLNDFFCPLRLRSIKSLSLITLLLISRITHGIRWVNKGSGLHSSQKAIQVRGETWGENWIVSFDISRRVRREHRGRFFLYRDNQNIDPNLAKNLNEKGGIYCPCQEEKGSKGVRSSFFTPIHHQKKVKTSLNL